MKTKLRLYCELWRAYPHLFKDAGIYPETVYWANNEEGVISLVQVGLGMSIMPVWRDLEHIVYVPIADKNITRTLGLKWRGQQTS